MSWLNKFFWNSHFALLLSLLNICIYIYIENYVLFLRTSAVGRWCSCGLSHIILHNRHADIYIKSQLININMTVSRKQRFIIKNGYMFLTHLSFCFSDAWTGAPWPNWDFESPPYTLALYGLTERAYFSKKKHSYFPLFIFTWRKKVIFAWDIMRLSKKTMYFCDELCLYVLLKWACLTASSDIYY